MSLPKQVMDVIDAVIVLKKPEPADVAKALKVPLPLTESKLAFEKHAAVFAKGPFSDANLRYTKGTAFGQLSLTARKEPPIHRNELDLLRFGPLPGPSINPDIPPEGTVSYKFEFPAEAPNVVELIFQFTAKSKVLSAVVLAWTRAAAPPVGR
jgi:hypothetical protein